MMRITINITDFEDLAFYRQSALIDELIEGFKSVVANGGEIEIRQEYSNAPPDILCIVNSTLALENWRQRLNDSMATLDKHNSTAVEQGKG
jgi:hypothetical protein